MNEKQNVMDEKLTSISKFIYNNGDLPKLYYNFFYTMSKQQLYTDQRIDDVKERIEKIIALLEDTKSDKDE